MTQTGSAAPGGDHKTGAEIFIFISPSHLISFTVSTKGNLCVTDEASQTEF